MKIAIELDITIVIHCIKWIYRNRVHNKDIITHCDLLMILMTSCDKILVV